MRSKQMISALLLVIGLALGLVTVCTAAYAVQAAPKILKTPQGALEQVGTVMDAVCEGDYAGASAGIYGKPALGTVPEQADPTVVLAWDAYRKSFSWSACGELRASDSGVSLDVQVRYLNLAAALADWAEQGPDRDRADSFFQKALKEPSFFREEIITLDLIYDNNQWWVLPGTELTNMLSGSFSE